MNIIYLSDASLPGKAAHTVHIMKMCQGIADNGHIVTLIAHSKNKPSKPSINIYEYYGVQQNFELRLTNYPFQRGRFLAELLSLKYVLQKRPDLVYGRSLYGCYFVSKFTSIPVCFEVHTKINKKTRFGRMLRQLIKSPHFVRLIVISQKMKDYFMKEWEIAQEKIVIAADAADPITTLEEKIPLKELKSGKNIGYIGSLNAGRGIELIVALAKAFPEHMFHIIGGKESDLQYWKQKVEFCNNLIFYGHVPHRLVSSYGTQMDILLAPYQRHVYLNRDKSSVDTVEYMSPMKIFEYMSFGKPFICSDLPVIREVLTHNVNCILCQPENIEDWKNAILALCGNTEFAKQLGQNALHEFQHKYTWKRRAQEVLK